MQAGSALSLEPCWHSGRNLSFISLAHCWGSTKMRHFGFTVDHNGLGSLYYCKGIVYTKPYYVLMIRTTITTTTTTTNTVPIAFAIATAMAIASTPP